jgi:Raf kinase inhibitor-like YbhB/YbcL family protein
MVHKGISSAFGGSLLFLAGAMSAASAQTGAPHPAPFVLTSTALKDGAMLDKHYAGPNDDRAKCGGDNVSLPMSWANPPAKTKSFAIILFDMEGGSNGGVVHWIAYGIPSDATGLAAGDGNTVSKKFVGGKNNRGLATYVGPCAPTADLPHHYIYSVYALDVPVDELQPGLTRDEFMAKVKGRVLNVSSLVSRYKRP